jgi:hypothetical protein
MNKININDNININMKKMNKETNINKKIIK